MVGQEGWWNSMKIKVQVESCSLPAPSYYIAPQLSARHHSKNILLWQGGGRPGHFQLPFFISTLTYIVIQEGQLLLIECSLGHQFFPAWHLWETGNVILILRLKKLRPSGLKALSPEYSASKQQGVCVWSLSCFSKFLSFQYDEPHIQVFHHSLNWTWGSVCLGWGTASTHQL